jgi:hypothetical protein|nr:MAG TPA: Ribosome-associated factor Y protein S30Ae family, Structural.7A [Caudoviricetes sp.]
MFITEENYNLTYIIGKENGKYTTATVKEILNEALRQERIGIFPHYVFWDYENQKAITTPGWMIWTSYNHGCGVVYRRKDGKMVLLTGMQGDFAYMA